MNKEREAGYYWVKDELKDPWIIAYYTGSNWEDNGKYVSDEYWSEIDENKLTHE